MRIPLTSALVAALALLVGCHRAGPPPLATTQDIEAAKQEAQREVAQARAEASKDVKSAAKVTGSHPNEVREAKVTGSYDVAMARADGDHKVAQTQCLAVEAALQQACRDKADQDFEKASAAAKATRLARQQ
jgi:hypothetical protein